VAAGIGQEIFNAAARNRERFFGSQIPVRSGPFEPHFAVAAFARTFFVS
jgi:hypothetical protein